MKLELVEQDLYQRYEKVELGDGSSQGEGEHHHEIPEEEKLLYYIQI